MLAVRPIEPSRTLSEWHTKAISLDMEPSYQRRGKIWPDGHQKLLVNTVLNEYDIPKLYFHDFTYGIDSLSESRKHYAVIDGKQRISTLFRFLEGDLKLDDTPVWYEGVEYNLKGKTFRNLQAGTSAERALAKKAEDYKLTVMSVISDDLVEIRELFIRLNMNLSVSGPEKRNAMRGPVPDYIRRLSTHEFFRENSRFPNNRGQDLNLAAKILLFERNEGFATSKKSNLDRFVKTFEKEEAGVLDKEFSRAKDTLDFMTKVFHSKDQLLGQQAQLLIYYSVCKNFSGVATPVFIRTIFGAFEEMRKEERVAQRARSLGKDAPVKNQNVFDYNLMVRTPDDKDKQKSMYSIMISFIESLLSDTKPS